MNIKINQKSFEKDCYSGEFIRNIGNDLNPKNVSIFFTIYNINDKIEIKWDSWRPGNNIEKIEDEIKQKFNEL